MNVSALKKKLDRWEKWEREYARRGFRTISLDDFVSLGGYGQPVNHLLRIKREEGEEPIYHSERYKERYLGKVEPAINLDKMMKDGNPQVAEWIIPTTED